jgi:hypothetical protein
MVVCGACCREARPASMLCVYLSAYSQASPLSAPRQGALGQVVPRLFLHAVFLARILACSSLWAELVKSVCACATRPTVVFRVSRHSMSQAARYVHDPCVGDWAWFPVPGMLEVCVFRVSRLCMTPASLPIASVIAAPARLPGRYSTYGRALY